MKVLILLLLSSLFFSASCTKEEEPFVFDIIVKREDQTAITDGFVRISGNRYGISLGLETVYQNEIRPSNEGKIHLEVPFTSRIQEFYVEYWLSSSRDVSQNMIGCDDPLSKLNCNLRNIDQRKFNIEITVLE